MKSQRRISTSGKENTTCLLCISAEGNMLPLLCVFKASMRWKTEWTNKHLHKQQCHLVKAVGWRLINIGTERPVLPIYDGHSTYISTKLIHMAQQNDVTTFKLPPHTYNQYSSDPRCFCVQKFETEVG